MKQTMRRLLCCVTLLMCLLAAMPTAAGAGASEFDWHGNAAALDDPLNMEALYWQCCAAHGYRTFRQWSLEDQAAFAGLLKVLRRRQLDRYGGLPAFAQQILANEYLLPTDEMLPQAQAVEAARRYARQQPGFAAAEAEVCVSLYQTSLGLVFWHVEFRSGRETLLKVRVDAFTGGALPVR